MADTFRTTTLCADRCRVSGVEHLFAALASLGLHDGIAIDVVTTKETSVAQAATDLELPLLDGGSGAWCDALAAVVSLVERVSPAPPPLTITRTETIDVEGSCYAFEPSTLASATAQVTVELEWPEKAKGALETTASWDGDADAFATRIASARTFAFKGDLEVMASHGLATHVDPASVVVLDEDGTAFASGRPFAGDEPARHKLIDLLGDLFVYGGPPAGTVHARRPGHTATHRAVAEALARGVLVHTDGARRPVC